MRAQVVILCILLITVSIIYLHGLTLFFGDSSFHPDRIWNRKPNSEKEQRQIKLDSCYEVFMELFKSYNINTKTAFFTELKTPIPVATMSYPCRKFLIPKPVAPTRLKELVRCYTPKHINYTSIGRVRRGLRIVKKIFDDNQVPLILCGGSLIGSHRYHGIIPYDDDFDFYIPADKRAFIKQKLTDLCKKDKSFGCLLNILPHLQLLIGVQDQTKKKYASFMDFFSYTPSNAFITNSAESTMFPLVKRPLEGDLYDAISNYPKYYQLTYKGNPIDMCNSFDHTYKTRVKGCKPVKCDELNSFLPFVVASETSAGRIEIGVNASHIRSIFFQRKSYGVFV